MRRHLVRWDEKYAARGLVIIEVDGGTFEALGPARESVEAQQVRHPVLHRPHRLLDDAVLGVGLGGPGILVRRHAEEEDRRDTQAGRLLGLVQQLVDR